ncbi:MAG: GSU2403 family nucleotidyltransferase fold protein [Gammaproteobacteria bacterium]
MVTLYVAELPSIAGLVKIGEAEDCSHTRVQEWGNSTGCPEDPLVLFAARVPDTTGADKRIIHPQLVDRCTKGGGSEWFWVSAEDAVEIILKTYPGAVIIHDPDGLAPEGIQIIDERIRQLEALRERELEKERAQRLRKWRARAKTTSVNTANPPSIIRYSLELQTIYSELVEQLQIAELEHLAEYEGFFTRRKRYNQHYWYFRYRVGDKHQDRYIGPETPKLLGRIEKLKVQAADAKAAAKVRRRLAELLRTGQYLTTDRSIGLVLRELGRAGVFQDGGVLIGTHAFRCYPALLCTKLNTYPMLMEEMDIGRDGTVMLGAVDPPNTRLSDALATAREVIDPTSILSPQENTSSDLGFLLAETVRAAVLTGSGVLVRVPTPERYALHKLIVAERRGVAARDKAQNDLGQAQTLLEVLLEDRPDDVKDVWADLVDRGKKWKTEAMKSVRRLPKPMQEPFR